MRAPPRAVCPPPARTKRAPRARAAPRARLHVAQLPAASRSWPGAGTRGRRLPLKQSAEQARSARRARPPRPRGSGAARPRRPSETSGTARRRCRRVGPCSPLRQPALTIPPPGAESSRWAFAEDDEEVPLLDVKAPTLRKIVEYMEHYKDAKPPEIEKPLRSSKMEQVVPEWDAKFVDAPQETLFELILGANYMDIKPLLDLTCAKVASVSPRCAHLRAAPRPFSPRPSQSESAALDRPPPRR